MAGEEYPIESGLYGLKGDLMEQLRDGRVPRWLAADHPSMGGSTSIKPTELSASDFLSAWVEQATERGDTQYVAFAVKGAPSTQVKHGGLAIAGRASRHATPEAPEKVLERCREFVGSPQYREVDASIDNRTGRFTGFYVSVRIGERGGIQDANLKAMFQQ